LTPCYECWSYGVDRAKNDWVMILGSDDFMSPEWDSNIIKRFPQYNHNNYVFQPVFGFISRPRDDPSLPPGEVPDDHPNHPGWKALYIYYKTQEHKPLLESMVYDHYYRNRVDNVFIEQGGHRSDIGYWATVVHMDVVDKIRPLNLNHQLFDWRHVMDEYEFNGKTKGALDIDFDDKLNDVGVLKVGVLDSFFYNLKHYRQNPDGRDHNFIFDRGEL